MQPYIQAYKPHPFLQGNAYGYWKNKAKPSLYYSTFGAPMPGLTFTSSTAYRFGFNGQEREDEIFKGAYTAEYWEYDARLGRRWNQDPIVKPWESPYATMYNSPIFFSDPFGDDPPERLSRWQRFNNWMKGDKYLNDVNAYAVENGIDESQVKHGYDPVKKQHYMSAPLASTQGEGSYYDASMGMVGPEALIGEKRFYDDEDVEAQQHYWERGAGSVMAQETGKFIAEFHPAVPLYNLGSNTGMWGDGTNYWGEEQSNADVILGVVTIIPAGKVLKGAQVLKAGKIVLKTANGIEITGFAKHALSRALERGVTSAQILDAIRNPLKVGEVVIDELGRPSQRFIGRFAEIVVNPNSGQIISLNPTSSRKAAKLLKQLNNGN